MIKSAELSSLISEIIGVPEEELTSESGMGNPADWDSFAQISIMVAAEEKWNLQFSPIEIGENSKFVEILNLINKKL
jgi:acyl carrier protein